MKLSWRQKRRNRKVKKLQKKLYCRVFSKRKDWHPALYYPLQTLTALLEVIKRTISTAISLALIGIMMLTIGATIAVMKITPIYESYDTEVKIILADSSPSDFNINESSIIYNSDGRILANLYETADTKYLEYDEIPKHVVNAFVAVEDRTFWENEGYDPKGITRVLYRYVLTKGEEAHGASTITQQLARNIYLTHEVSFERKAKEILIAKYLTQRYTKEDIMEFYVNDICFANGIYGIDGAAKAYFDKDVDELSLKQIAYLCSIPNSPSYYDPYKNPQNALARAEKILDDMKECGYITDSEYRIAKNERVNIVEPEYEFNNYETTYAIDCAVKYLMKLDGFEFRYEFNDMDDYNSYHNDYDEVFASYKHQLYTKGYRVYTSLDSEVYNTLQEILNNGLAFDSEINEETGIYALQGAISCIDNQTRKVVAVVGGRSQEGENRVYGLNRAYQSYRQPGSSIKPIAVYTPAIETGRYSASSTVENISVDAAKEKGADIQNLHGDVMTLRQAVELSKNGVAYKIFDSITPAYGMSFLTSMKFSNLCPNDYFNSSALGGLTYGVSTVEMASAYSTLANHGVFVEPTCITSIIDRDGNEIYVEDEPIKVYTSKASDDMVDILKGVLTNGTGSRLGWYRRTDIEAFAKTGTTNNNKDGWLCGATPYYSIAVWVGYDTPKLLNNLQGATYPGQIWADSMETLVDGLEVAVFERDTEDESYTNIVRQDSYYSYLEGRDDSEVLSEGYTVANYREDRVIGESVIQIVNQINGLDRNSENFQTNLQNLYSQGCSIIDTIYSIKYTNEMQIMLDTAYNEVLGNVAPVQPEAQVAQPNQ